MDIPTSQPVRPVWQLYLCADASKLNKVGGLFQLKFSEKHNAIDILAKGNTQNILPGDDFLSPIPDLYPRKPCLGHNLGYACPFAPIPFPVDGGC
jgi:hypothetical protein